MRIIRLEDYERELDARKAALGITGEDYVLRNDGARRTPEKRKLLRALADLAKAQGREPPFKANY